LSSRDRDSLINPVLPCEDFDVEVVSDVIEDMDDIEVAAVVDEEHPALRTTDNNEDQEPDYDVEVACEVQDAEEPDLEMTLSITGDSNDAVRPEPNG